MPVSFESFELKSNEFDVVACMNTSLAKLVLNNMIVNSITKVEGYCHKYCNVKNLFSEISGMYPLKKLKRYSVIYISNFEN